MVTEKAKQVGYCAKNKLCEAIPIFFSNKLAGMKDKVDRREAHYPDFSRAFDTVPNDIFSWKWASIKWVIKWLRERGTYWVVVNTSKAKCVGEQILNLNQLKLYGRNFSLTLAISIASIRWFSPSVFKHGSIFFCNQEKLKSVFWKQVFKASNVNGVSSYLVPKKSKTWGKKPYEGAISKVNI